MGVAAPPARNCSLFSRYIRTHLRLADRHIIVSRNHNAAPLPPIDRPAELRRGNTALARSFRYRIPQPPAPRGRRDRVYRRTDYPTGPTRVGPFSFSSDRPRCCLTRGSEPVTKIPSPAASFQIPSGIAPDIDEYRPMSVAEPLSSHSRTAAIPRTGNRAFKIGWYRRMFELSGVCRQPCT
jgi:hypothetical protein